MTVLVYGASGWTGSQIAAALATAGVPITLGGRSRQRLRRLRRDLPARPPLAVAALDDARALRRAASGARLVINCAGPFVETGHALLEAALATGAHYLDVSGEESHVAEVHREVGRDARRRGVTVCAGFAAKGALGDWTARLLAEEARAGEVRAVAVAYAHGLREFFSPSVASVLSSATQGFLQPRGERLRGRRFAFPPPFGTGLAVPVPAAEQVFIPQHFPGADVRTFVAVDPGGRMNRPWTELLRAATPWMPLIASVWLSAWGRFHLDLYLPRPERRHERDSFAVAVELRGRAGGAARMAAVTHDAYGVTADIIALGARALLAGEAPAGVLSPSQICPPRAALAALARSGAIRVYRPR